MATNTRWGYDRIVGELRKLRIYSVSRATVSRVLQENGFDRSPRRRRKGLNSVGSTADDQWEFDSNEPLDQATYRQLCIT
jgi:hypothetical protein